MRGQYLIIAFLLTLLLVLFAVSSFYGFYHSKLPGLHELDFPERAQKTAELI